MAFRNITCLPLAVEMHTRGNGSLWVQCPFTFGVEIFEAGHRTTPHSHASAHELFFILAGARLKADKTLALAMRGGSLQ